MRRGKACSGFSKTTQDGPCATRRKSVAGRAWGIARYTRLFPSFSMRRNSKPVFFPPPVSRCMPSMRPPAGASQTSSFTVPWSSPDQEPASQPSWARSRDPGTSAGHSGAVARSSKVRKVIVRSVRGGLRSSCVEGRAGVLDGSGTEQRAQRAKRLDQRPRREPGDPAELPGEVRLVHVVQLGRELRPARLAVAQEQRRLDPEHRGEGARRKPDLAAEGALQRPLAGAGRLP